MSDSDSHPALGGDAHTALMLLGKDVRGLGDRLTEYCERVDRRLAQGDTEIALLKDRQNNHGSLIGSLQVQFNGLRQDHESTACRGCEGRIKALEDKDIKRAERESGEEAAANRAPAWWMQVVISTAITALVTAGMVWVLRGGLSDERPRTEERAP